jgi:uncharacterized membrane protein
MVVVSHDLPQKLEPYLIHTKLFLGTLPTTTGATVTLSACQRGFLKCCDLSFPIDVHNCGEFNVFRLTPTLFLFLPYDCLLHHIEDYAILIFVRHAQGIVKPKFK